MNCKKCGAIVPEGSTSCNVCGAPIAPAVPQHAQGGNFGAAPVSPRVPTVASAPAQRCPQCGNALAPNARFCSSCGASFAAAPISPKPIAPKPVAKGSFLANSPRFTIAGKSIPLYGAIAAAVALVVVVVLLFSIFGDNGRSNDSKKSDDDDIESIAQTFIEGYYYGDCDAEDFIELYHEDYVEYLLDNFYIDEDELIDELEDEFEDRRYENEYDDIELDEIEIKSIKDQKKKDYDYLIEYYEDTYDLEITAIKMVKCKVHYEMDGDEYSNTEEVLVVKIDGDYYITNYILENVAWEAS